MKGYSRRKEIIKSGICMVIGIIGLYFVSINLHTLNTQDQEILIDTQEVQGQIPIVNQQENALNIDQLFEWSNKTLDEENMSQLLSYLPGASYLSSVQVQQEKVPYQVKITYKAEQYDPMLSKSRKEQIVLLDASIIMSLYPNIDTVQINMIVDTDVYRKVLYRPDLEDYFGINIEAKNEKRTFERIVREFMDMEHVSHYWNSKHPYDSKLGEEVAHFFKMNFPAKTKVEEVFPYVDEELENTLVEQYGYKLFLQGLAYENALINYYSAYRLPEYYGNKNKEEIMLELAICANQSEDKRVQHACQNVMELMKPLQTGETRVFGRFSESALGGGKKIYRIDEKGLDVLAKWVGDTEAGLKVLGLSPNNQYVICEAQTKQQAYLFILPVTEKVDYQIDRSGVYQNQEKCQPELMQKINEILQRDESNKILQGEQLKFEWMLDSLLKIQVGEQKTLVYDVQNAHLQTNESFIQNFEMAYLQRYLEEKFEIDINIYSDTKTKAEVKKVLINHEALLIYNYANVAQKNVELVKWKEDADYKVDKYWSKGKVVVYYEGDNQEIINVLNQAMKS